MKVDWQHSKNKRKSKTNTEGKVILEALKHSDKVLKERYGGYTRGNHKVTLKRKKGDK